MNEYMLVNLTIARIGYAGRRYPCMYNQKYCIFFVPNDVCCDEVDLHVDRYDWMPCNDV